MTAIAMRKDLRVPDEARAPYNKRAMMTDMPSLLAALRQAAEEIEERAGVGKGASSGGPVAPHGPTRAAPDFGLLQTRLLQLLRNGLALPTGEAWLEYWDSSEGDRSPIDDFASMMEGLIAAMDAEEPLGDLGANAERCHRVIVAGFPGSEDTLRFAESTMRRAASLVIGLIATPLASPARKTADARQAQVYNWSLKWYRVAVNSLLLVADEQLDPPSPVEPDVISTVIEIARASALAAYGAVLGGKSLRDDEAIELGVVDLVEPDDDVVSDDADLADVEEYIAKFEAP